MNPYVVVGAIVALLAALAGSYFEGKSAGKEETVAAYQKRDNEALRTAVGKIKALEDEAREIERKRAEEVAGISEGYQKEIEYEKARNSALSARVRSGELRLLDRSAVASRCDSPGAAAAPSGPGGRDGPQGRELSREASEFLLGLAGEADAVARQLSACQAVIRSDRTAALPPATLAGDY